jgi:hypothetical protein
MGVLHGGVDRRGEKESNAHLADGAGGGRSMGMPQASSRSALPHWLEMERLPCLATCMPAPATTNAPSVEMLNVLAPSPPVPQVSSRV